MMNLVLSALVGDRRAPTLRRLLLAAAFGTGLLLLAGIFDTHYPIAEWLFWRYAVAISATGAFCLASLSVGNWIVTALSLPGERQDGHLTLGFATGVYAFFLAVFLVGVAGALDPFMFVAIPGLLFAIGARKLAGDLVRWHASRQGPRLIAPLSAWEALAFGIGVVALLIVYAPTLVPDNTAYDTRWYHLALGEHYVAGGAIGRSPEGSVLATVPPLGSVLYTWAFLLPGSDLFDRIVLAAHMEVAIFLFTLGGIPALVRYLLPGTNARLSWVVLFLFPAIFIYDSTLTVASDHIAALWTIPTYLAMARALRELRPAACLLFIVQICGLVVTKYTALTAALVPLVLVLGRAVQLAWRRLRGRSRVNVAYGLLVGLGAGLVLSAPHWLKNWLWYGDPVYPILHKYLPVHPWNPDSPFLYQVYQETSWLAKGTPIQKLKGAWMSLYNHSYELYTWENFHGRFPVFGSLFTFGLLALPFLRGARRVWALVVATHVGVVFWFLFFQNDRYLQSLLPWMAACVAAVAILSWREGLAGRAGVVALFGLQAIWGLDVIFWPTHQMNGKSGIALVNEFFGRAFSKDFASRTRTFEAYAAVGRGLPKGAKLLWHHEHTRLGVGVMTVTDSPRIQHGISYGYLGSPSALHRLLGEFGVTHVAWDRGVAFDDQSIAEDLVFHAYVEQLADPVRRGSKTVGSVSPRGPLDRPSSVFVFLCDGTYEPGLYDLADLRVSPYVLPNVTKTYPKPRQPLGPDVASLLQGVGYAVIGQRCSGAPPLGDFRRIAAGAGKEFYWRQ